MQANIIYKGIDLEVDLGMEILTEPPDGRGYPLAKTFTSEVATVAGQLLHKIQHGIRLIEIRGMIVGTSNSDLMVKLDSIKQTLDNVTSNTPGKLTITSGRYYKALFTELIFGEMGPWRETFHAEFTLRFTCTDPFEYADPTVVCKATAANEVIRLDGGNVDTRPDILVQGKTTSGVKVISSRQQCVGNFDKNVELLLNSGGHADGILFCPFNYLTDGDMELDGVTNWSAGVNATVVKSSDYVRHGSQSLKVTTTAANGYAAQAFNGGSMWYGSWEVWIFDPLAAGLAVEVIIYDTGGAGTELDKISFSTNGKWQCASGTFTYLTNAYQVRIKIGPTASTVYVSEAWVTDNVVVNPGFEHATPLYGWTQGGGAGTCGVSAGSKHSGSQGAYIYPTTPTDRYLYQTITGLTNGQYYLLRLFASAPVIGSGGSVSSYYVNTEPPRALYTATSGMTLTEHVIKMSGTSITIYLRAGTNTTIGLFDDVSLIPLYLTDLPRYRQSRHHSGVVVRSGEVLAFSPLNDQVEFSLHVRAKLLWSAVGPWYETLHREVITLCRLFVGNLRDCAIEFDCKTSKWRAHLFSNVGETQLAGTPASSHTENDVVDIVVVVNSIGLYLYVNGVLLGTGTTRAIENPLTFLAFNGDIVVEACQVFFVALTSREVKILCKEETFSYKGTLLNTTANLAENDTLQLKCDQTAWFYDQSAETLTNIDGSFTGDFPIVYASRGALVFVRDLRYVEIAYQKRWL